MDYDYDDMTTHQRRMLDEMNMRDRRTKLKRVYMQLTLQAHRSAYVPFQREHVKFAQEVIMDKVKF